MKLIPQHADGTRGKPSPWNYHSYADAQSGADYIFRAHPTTAAIFLQDDDGKKIVRTYFRLDGKRVVWIRGEHAPTPPPTMFPGVWLEGRPEFPCDGIVRLSEAAYEHELNEADRRGYERGLREGLRASLYPYQGGYKRFLEAFGGGRNMGKTAYLEGSVRAGVRGATREQSRNHSYAETWGPNPRHNRSY